MKPDKGVYDVCNGKERLFPQAPQWAPWTFKTAFLSALVMKCPAHTLCDLEMQRNLNYSKACDAIMGNKNWSKHHLIHTTVPL